MSIVMNQQYDQKLKSDQNELLSQSKWNPSDVVGHEVMHEVMNQLWRYGLQETTAEQVI